MKLKKLLALIIAAATLLPLLASCGNGTADTTDAETIAPVTTGSPDETEQGDKTDETGTEGTESAASTDEKTETGAGTETRTDTETDPDTSPDTAETTAEAEDPETSAETPEDTTVQTSDPGVTTSEDQPGEVTTKAPETTKEPETTKAPETTKTPETTDAPETKPVEEKKATAKDLMFRQVYGTGYNNDTPVRYSFIEIYNTSEYPFNLKGLAIYSYDVNSKKYVSKEFPDVTVPASTSYLIRCAEAKGKQGAAYKSEGERLSVKYYDLSWDIVLDNKEIQLVIADKGKTYGDVKASAAQGRYVYFIGTQTVTTDKNAMVGLTKNKAAFRSPTDDKYELVDYKNAPASQIMDHAPMCLKGDLNGLASASANVVMFSHEAGVYGSAFELKLSAADGYTIYYTTDGTDPSVNGGTKYTAPIKIANSDTLPWGLLTKRCNSLNGAANPKNMRQIGARVIKAYAKDSKNNKTQVVTNTYFVSSKLSDYNTMLISMSVEPDDFLSSDKGIYHTQMADPFGTKQRRTTFTEIFETNGKRVSGSYTEIALNGNGSLGFQAKSIRIYFKADAKEGYIGNPSKLKYDIFKGQARDGVTEYKRVLLRNSGNDSSQSHLRDAYMQKMCSELNVPTMAYRPVLLFINGEMWGVYNARERYDAKYFESHYGIPEEDFCMLEAPSPLTTGGNGNTPYVVNDGNEGDEKPFHELVAYIENNDLADDSKFKYVSDRIDIDNMIDFFVGSMYMANIDWPWNNIKVWRNKNASSKTNDTKWRFVFCDMDMGTGLQTEINTNMFTYAIHDGTVAGRMMNRMLRNESFKNKFIDRFYECAETMFAPDKAIPVLNEMYAAIKNIMPLHFIRWPGDGGSEANFENQINSIKYFMNNRRAKTISHMEEFFHIQPKRLTVSFDEDSASVTVDGGSVRSGYSKQIKGTGKATVAVSVKSGYELAAIKCTDGKGATKTYTSKNVTLNIDSTLNVVILTKKTGASYTPAVATGSRAVLATASDGTLYAWGENEYGQLGITSSTVTKPVPVFSNVAAAAISMGGTESDAPMTAVLTASGAVYTAGNNSAGQLGRTGNTYSFVKLELGFKAKAISCGFDHMIIIAENGDMYGVGNNTYGQLGGANFDKNVSKLQKIDTGVKAAAAGRRHTVYIKNDGSLYVLGDNRWNKFKAGAEEKITTPLKLGDGYGFVSTGQHNALAIKTNGELYYLGWRSTTSFNAGEAAGQPVKIASAVKAAYIQDEHIIMLGTDGKVYGYGLNNYQQISTDGQTKNSPYKIMDGCIGCGAGTHYSAAIKTDGSLVLWGNNARGTIGNGSVSDSYVSAYKAINLK